MSDCPSSRSFARALLIRNKPVAEGIFELEFDWNGPGPSSGQFFLIRAVRSSVLLGRAISVYRWQPSGDRAGGRLSFLIAVRGIGTIELQDLQAGEYAELVGPLGNSWSTALPSDLIEGNAPRRPIALIGGGIGIAPVAYLAAELPAATFDFYAGFRSRSYGLEGIQPRTLTIATEDGSEGHRGRILDFLEYGQYGAVCACGPEPMLQAVAAGCLAAGVQAFLSLERRMACGVGACLGCTVRTKSGNRRCCADGPIFAAEEISFDD